VIATLVDTMSHFPTVVPTAALMFCVAWWVVSLIVSGVDGGGEAPQTRGPRGPRAARAPKVRNGRRGRSRTGGRGRRLLKADVIPFSMALTVLSFGSWAVCLLGAGLLERADLTRGVEIAAGSGLLIVSLLSGLGLLTAFAIPAEKILITNTAPTRSDAVGALCRVRSIKDGRGDARVLTGPTTGALVPITVAPGVDLVAGDDALVITYDDDLDRFVVSDLDEILRPSV
jgi:hypothetical protein